MVYFISVPFELTRTAFLLSPAVRRDDLVQAVYGAVKLLDGIIKAVYVDIADLLDGVRHCFGIVGQDSIDI